MKQKQAALLALSRPCSPIQVKGAFLTPPFSQPRPPVKRRVTFASRFMWEATTLPAKMTWSPANSSSYRSNQLALKAASLGIALIHIKPYIPEGRSKIERWLETVRMSFLAALLEGLTLAKLNEQLWEWIEKR
jgi:hypothetical protein